MNSDKPRLVKMCSGAWGLLEGFILTLFDWSRAWGFSSNTSISDFISSLFLISHDVNS